MIFCYGVRTGKNLNSERLSMKINLPTSTQRLPIDRLKHPLRPVDNEPVKPEDLLFGDKEGEELEKVVKRLYQQKIKK